MLIRRTQAPHDRSADKPAKDSAISTLDQPPTPERPLDAEAGIAVEDTRFLYDDVDAANVDPDLSQQDIDNIADSSEDVPVTPKDDNDAEHLFAPADDDADASMDVEADSSDMVASVDCLQTLGVEPENATRYAAAIIRRQTEKPATVCCL